MQEDTRIQHHAEDRLRPGSSVAPPIHRTSLFTFEDTASFEKAFRGSGGEPLYTRNSNPTTRVLERKIADLEEMEDCLAMASGMAAVSATLLGLLEKGDHLVILSSSYAPTLALARGPLTRFGVETTFLPAGEFGDLEKHVRESTRLIYLEAPASLTFEVPDIRHVAQLAREGGLVTVLDNSWATPIFQKPSRFGIDLSLHSGTKYLGGHSDILLGAVAGSVALIRRIQRTAVLLGGTLSPEDAFLAIRGLRTLPLRMRRHEASGLQVARFLREQPRVSRVLHPGLDDFPDHATARSQLSGWSGLFSFVLDGDPRAFADALKIFRIGVSWGGFESLVLPLISTAPREPDRALRPDLPPGLIRLSIGLEDPGDLIEDLRRGFATL